MKETEKNPKDKRTNLINAFGNATKNTVNNIGNATKNAAISVTESIKESSEQISKQLDQMKYDNDKKHLCPIYKDEINSPDFRLPAMVRIVDEDKRRYNKACEGSIGFQTGNKDTKLLSIYREFSDLLGISFYPFLDNSVYYVDPCNKKLYIKIDEYFTYLKKVRVDELTTIAQYLGATYMEINLKENKKSSTYENKSGGLKALKKGAEVSTSKSKIENTVLEVAAKIDFVGNHNPIKPKLVYFKNESDIKALIKMRTNSSNENQILSKTYSLQYGNSSGITISDAEKIDLMLYNINYGLRRSFTSEALFESNTILEYVIIF